VRLDWLCSWLSSPRPNAEASGRPTIQPVSRSAKVEAPEDASEDDENIIQCESSETAISSTAEAQALSAPSAQTVAALFTTRAEVFPSIQTPSPGNVRSRRNRRSASVCSSAERIHSIASSTNAPTAFTAPQLRVLFSALIHMDAYEFAEDVAAQFVGDDENNQQSAEEVLLSVIDGLEDEKLPAFALRLAFTSHVDIPRESEIDHLIEAEKLFVPVQPKQVKAKTTSTKSAKKPIATKSRAGKKKATKKLAA
jgi:hypothetical protein